MSVSLRDTTWAAASFGVAGALLLGARRSLLPTALGLSFVAWRIGRMLFAATGIRLGRGRLCLRGSALFGRLAGSLPRRSFFRSLLRSFGGPTHSGGPAVVCSVGNVREACHQHHTRAESDRGDPRTEHPGG